MPTATKTRLQQVLDERDGWIDNLLDGFETALASITATAQARTLALITAALEIVDGVVLQTPANMRVLRTLDALLIRELNRAGHQALVEEFVSGFPGALPFLDDILDAISEKIGVPLTVRLTPTDLAVLESQQITVAEGLSGLLETAAGVVRRKTMFSVAAAPYADVVEQVAATLNASIVEARTMADTSLVMFARTVTDRGFQQIENGLQPGAVKYSYEGPNDKLTRPFCRRMLKHEQMTREEIEALDNGQLPNPMVTCGGFNCRHTWVVEAIA